MTHANAQERIELYTSDYDCNTADDREEARQEAIGELADELINGATLELAGGTFTLAQVLDRQCIDVDGISSQALKSLAEQEYETICEFCDEVLTAQEQEAEDEYVSREAG